MQYLQCISSIELSGFVFIPEVDKLWPILSPQTSLAQKTERCFLKASIFSMAVSTQHQTSGRKVKKEQKTNQSDLLLPQCKTSSYFQRCELLWGCVGTAYHMSEAGGSRGRKYFFWSRKMYLRCSNLNKNKQGLFLVSFKQSFNHDTRQLTKWHILHTEYFKGINLYAMITIKTVRLSAVQSNPSIYLAFHNNYHKTTKPGIK